MPSDRPPAGVPFYSVVIPTYNRAWTVRRAIKSVLAQSLQDFEILVMDDGSTDCTAEVVASLADPRIRYAWAPNSGGPATPRNRGIDAARGHWVSFLDSDDVWHPAKLERVAEAIRHDPSLDVVSHYEYVWLRARSEARLLRHGPFVPDFYRAMLVAGNRCSTSAMTVKRDFLEQHALRFDDTKEYVIVEDYDLWLRVAVLGGRFDFLPTSLGAYVIDDGNISSDSAKLRSNRRTVLKNHVFRIQQFEPEPRKLWRQIRVRLAVHEASARMKGGSYAAILRDVAAAIASSPVGTLGLVSCWAQRFWQSRLLGIEGPSWDVGEWLRLLGEGDGRTSMAGHV